MLKNAKNAKKGLKSHELSWEPNMIGQRTRNKENTSAVRILRLQLILKVEWSTITTQRNKTKYFVSDISRFEDVQTYSPYHELWVSIGIKAVVSHLWSLHIILV